MTTQCVVHTTTITGDSSVTAGKLLDVFVVEKERISVPIPVDCQLGDRASLINYLSLSLFLFLQKQK